METPNTTSGDTCTYAVRLCVCTYVRTYATPDVYLRMCNSWRVYVCTCVCVCNMEEDCVHTLKMKGISLELAWITSSLVTGDTEKFSSLYHRHQSAKWCLWVGGSMLWAAITYTQCMCASTVGQTRRWRKGRPCCQQCHGGTLCSHRWWHNGAAIPSWHLPPWGPTGATEAQLWDHTAPDTTAWIEGM